MLMRMRSQISESPTKHDEVMEVALENNSDDMSVAVQQINIYSNGVRSKFTTKTFKKRDLSSVEY